VLDVPLPPSLASLVTTRVSSLGLGETLEQEKDPRRDVGKLRREGERSGEFVGGLRDEAQEEISMALKGGKPVGYEGGSSFGMETEGLYLRDTSRHERERGK
jgi:hypothetical protein